jgi:predicted DNA-binding transcriptional regulator YafY
MAKFVTIDYTNWRGERKHRYVRPISMEWGSNKWHPKPQWLMVAYDPDNEGERTFAYENIHSWVQDAEEPAADELADIPGDLATTPKRPE